MQAQEKFDLLKTNDCADVFHFAFAAGAPLWVFSPGLQDQIAPQRSQGTVAFWFRGRQDEQGLGLTYWETGSGEEYQISSDPGNARETWKSGQGTNSQFNNRKETSGEDFQHHLLPPQPPLAICFLRFYFLEVNLVRQFPGFSLALFVSLVPAQASVRFGIYDNIRERRVLAPA